MDNHFHLVVETPEPNLVFGMKWLLGTYTKRFNIRHKLCGHLFAGRYKSLVVEGNALALEFPEKVTLTVTGTPDGVKQGNKEAVLENGLTILVPHIVVVGDQVVVDTEDFSYVERVTLKSLKD